MICVGVGFFGQATKIKKLKLKIMGGLPEVGGKHRYLLDIHSSKPRNIEHKT
jgi:hypothetical protein